MKATYGDQRHLVREIDIDEATCASLNSRLTPKNLR